MKEWAKKNLSALISTVAVAVYALIAIVIAFGVGYGAKVGDDLVDLQLLTDNKALFGSAYSVAVSALIIGVAALAPVIIKWLFALFNIATFSRILGFISLLLVWVSIILSVVLNVQLILDDSIVVHVGSIIGFYILLFIGLVIATGTSIRK